MKRVHLFHGFVSERLGRETFSEELVDTCLQAMQDGVLDVCAQNKDGWNLWRCYGMTPHQWQRVCGLLQRAGIASSIFWQSEWFICQEFIKEIEYFWTDLDAVHRYLECRHWNPAWLLQELGWRQREWNKGLRRAWLAACTVS